MTVTHKFWASGPKWPPPPQPPFLIPHNNEKGVTLLRIQAAICLHSYHAKLCNTWRAVGQKLVCTCSCTDHLLSAQIQPKPLPKHLFTSIMQLMHNALRKMQVWNQLLVICLNTPAAYLWTFRAFLWPGTQTPPFNQITQKGCQSTGLELRIPKIYSYLVEVAQ